MNIRFLDGLRGIAALVVMLGHARQLLWEGYSSFNQHPETYPLLDRAMMYCFGIFRYGQEMVVLFFILSGFVIHLRFSDREKRPHLDFWPFMLRRFKRLYPPLLFVLLLAAVLDGLGKSYGWGIYSHQTQYANINRDIFSVTDPITLLGNLFFLMTVHVRPFGTTTVTWSLMYEWWFYVIYPLFYFLALRFGFKKTTLLVFLLFAATLFSDALQPLLFWKVMSNFIVWWMGACLVEIWTNRQSTTRKIYAALPYLAPVMLAGLLVKETGGEGARPFLPFLFGLGFTGIVAILLRTDPKNAFVRFLNWLKPLGDCSYTLYLIHLTIFVFASGWLMSVNGGELPKHHFFIIVAAVLVTLLAYGLHFLIEKPFTGRGPKRGI